MSASEALTASRQFFQFFLEKKSYYSAIFIAFRKFLEPFERTEFLRFETQLKKSNCSVFPLLAYQVQNIFKMLHFLVKFFK